MGSSAHTGTHTGVPRPPHQCTACCIAALLPVASQRSLLPRPRTPLELPQSTPRVGPTGQSGTFCIAAQPAAMHRPAASLHRQLHAAASVAAQCVRMRSAVCARYGSTLSPHLRLGTALIAHHRTGLIPAHICTGTNSTPRQTTRTVLQPHALCCNQVPPVHDAAADSTCCNRLHAAAPPCRWLHPIRSKRKRSEGAAGRIAWRVRGAVDEDGPRRKRGRVFDFPEYSLRRESTCHWQ